MLQFVRKFVNSNGCIYCKACVNGLLRLLLEEQNASIEFQRLIVDSCRWVELKHLQQ